MKMQIPNGSQSERAVGYRHAAQTHSVPSPSCCLYINMKSLKEGHDEIDLNLVREVKDITTL